MIQFNFVGEALVSQQYGHGSGTIHFRNFRCSGGEQQLLDCSSSSVLDPLDNGTDAGDCGHYRDAAVNCFHYPG